MRSNPMAVTGLCVLAVASAFSTRFLYGQIAGAPPQSASAAAAPPPVTLSGLARQTPVLPPCVLPEELDDPAFAAHADLFLLGHAWDLHDSKLLTDLALQFVEGERVLLRPHKAIDSGRLAEVAAHVAGERNDKSSLDRLEKSARARGETSLLPIIAEARSGAETIDQDELTVGHPIEDLSPEAMVLHQVVLKKIRSARLAGDAAVLDRLDRYVDQFKELHPGQHAQFDKLIAQARSRLPKQSSLAPTVKALERLSAVTPCAKAG